MSCEEGGSSSDSVDYNESNYDMMDINHHYQNSLQNNVLNAIDNNQPYLKIVEQPQSRGFRFRYQCEGSSHGGLRGEGTDRGKKSFPAVKIFNYVGQARITVTLVTDESVPKLHAHELIGKNCKNGMCMVLLNGDDMTAVFPNLGIRHVTKKKVVEILTERILESNKISHLLQTNTESKISASERKNIQRQAEEQARTMQLNVVRLCFQAYILGNDGAFSHMLPPVVSNPIYDSKSPGTAALKIYRMDKCGGCCYGNEEVFLLCDKVQKDDISVRFYELDEDSQVRWEAYGSFGATDVHRQYAIVFRTPPYQNKDIKHPVQVLVQLKRVSDGALSEAKSFVYHPRPIDMDEVDKKRMKPLPFGGAGSGGTGWNSDRGFGGPGFTGGGFGFGMDTPDGNFGHMSFHGNPGPGGAHNFTGRTGKRIKLEREESDSESDSGSDSGSYTSGSSTSGSGSDSGDDDDETGSSAQEGDISSEVDEVDGYSDADFMARLRSLNMDLPEASPSAIPVCSKPTKTVVEVPKVKKEKVKLSEEDKKKLSEEKKRLSAEKKKNMTPEERKKYEKEKKRTKALKRTASVLKADDSLALRLTDTSSRALQDYCRTGDVCFLLGIQHHLVSVPDKNLDTCLHLAVIHNQENVVHTLFKILPFPSLQQLINAQNKRHQTPLHLAVLTNQPNLVHWLCMYNADATITDGRGHTPLHLAARLGRQRIIDILLRDKTGIPEELTKYDFDGCNPLHLAIKLQHLECAKLLSQRADINQVEGRNGRTALHLAVEAGDILLAAHLILECNAGVNVQTYDGNTPLHVAVGHGMDDMTYFLISQGADPHIPNRQDDIVDQESGEQQAKEIQEPSLTKDASERPNGETAFTLARGNEKLLSILQGEEYRGKIIECNMDSSYGSLSSNLQTSSLNQRFSSLSLNKDGDLYRLDRSVRTRLSTLLDPLSPTMDWIALAEWLNMTAAVPELVNLPSPTMILLEKYEEINGTVEGLIKALNQMPREDAVALLRKSLNISKSDVATSEEAGDASKWGQEEATHDSNYHTLESLPSDRCDSIPLESQHR